MIITMDPGIPQIANPCMDNEDTLQDCNHDSIPF